MLGQLHNKLVHHIMQADQRVERAAARKGRYFNHYALAHMVGAAQKAREEAVETGGTEEDWVVAVMRNFTPTKSMHTFLKKIDPNVQVEYGSWVYRGERIR